MEKIRLSKLMAQRGLCSRREADVFIKHGWVYVDGEKITVLGTKVYPGQRISQEGCIDEQLIERMPNWRHTGFSTPNDKEMRIVALIHDPAAIRRILEPLKLGDPEPMQHGPPEDPEAAEPPDWPAKRELPLEYCPVPDIA